MKAPPLRRSRPLFIIWVCGMAGVLLLAVMAPGTSGILPRATVSRVNSDLRTVGEALELKRLEQGRFPEPEGDHLPSNLMQGGLPTDHHKVYRITDTTKAPVEIFTRSAWPVIVLYYLVLVIAGFGYWGFEPRRATALRMAKVLGAGALLHVSIAWVLNARLRHYLSESHVPREWESYQSFHYAADPQRGYVLQAVGVDQARDLRDLTGVPLGDGTIESMRLALTPSSYDPTNGALSQGDVFRIWINPVADEHTMKSVQSDESDQSVQSNVRAQTYAAARAGAIR